MRTAGFLAALGVVCTPASAYYHFVRFNTRTAPFVPIVERFDLNAVPGRTVTYRVSGAGPTELASNDSFSSVLSQIRAAARVWNSVETSELRLAFGGTFHPDLPQSAPGIDILFDEVPPGVIAYGGPTTRGDPTFSVTGTFVPIVRSVVVLRRDLTQRPSYSEGFFLTMVHELGHALGLQHTLTSSVMSKEITRGMTKAQPLSADDVAGISALYPSRSFSQVTGSLAGRVTLNNNGANLASVVAISPGGPVVGAMTNPDGTYRIDGIPPGEYFVYVHPLPPPLPGEVTPADIILPLDADRRPLAAVGAFETVFYPNLREPLISVPVRPGQTTEGIHFSVQPRPFQAVYLVQTYSFPGQLAVKPAHLSRAGVNPFIVAAGAGLVTNGQPTPGLRAAVMGTAAAVSSIRSYPSSSAFVQLDMQLGLIAREGLHHLLFSLNNDTYVLPAAFAITQKAPPSIASITPGFDGSTRVVTIAGANLGADTRILFDGETATVRSVDEVAGRLVVVPPQATANQRATVVALNGDGQSSLFLQGNAPPQYTFEQGDPGLITVSPSTLPAGSEGVIEINGVNTQFVDGLTTIGFGTSDVVARQVVVQSATRLLVSVAVAASAAVGLPLDVMVTTGLRTTTAVGGFQPGSFNPRQLVVSAPGSIQPGSTVALVVANLPPNVTPTVTLNGVSLAVLAVQGNQVLCQVPQGLPSGVAALRVLAGSEAASIFVTVSGAPPVINTILAGLVPLSATLPANATVDIVRPARAGDLVTIVTNGLGEVTGSSQVSVDVGGVAHTPAQIAAVPGLPNVHHVLVILSARIPAGPQIPVTITIDGRVSPAYNIPVR